MMKQVPEYVILKGAFHRIQCPPGVEEECLKDLKEAARWDVESRTMAAGFEVSKPDLANLTYTSKFIDLYKATLHAVDLDYEIIVSETIARHPWRVWKEALKQFIYVEDTFIRRDILNILEFPFFIFHIIMLLFDISTFRKSFLEYDQWK